MRHDAGADHAGGGGGRECGAHGFPATLLDKLAIDRDGLCAGHGWISSHSPKSSMEELARVGACHAGRALGWLAILRALCAILLAPQHLKGD